MIILLSILIVIGTLVLSGKLWRMGGDGQGWARAFAFPSLCALAKLALLALNLPWSWWFLLTFLYIPALWGLMSLISYGVTAPPHKFWMWVVGHWTGNYSDPVWRALANDGKIAAIEIATRCTCGFFWSLAAAIFAYLTGAWILFGVYVLFLTIANGLIWKYIKDVEKNERLVGACVATSTMI